MQEIKNLLEKNFELTKEIHEMTKKMSRYLFWQQIFSVLKLLIIIVPIVVGIIYLPPLLKNLMSQYQELLGIGNLNENAGNLLEGGVGDLDLSEIKKMLK